MDALKNEDLLDLPGDVSQMLVIVYWYLTAYNGSVVYRQIYTKYKDVDSINGL